MDDDEASDPNENLTIACLSNDHVSCENAPCECECHKDGQVLPAKPAD